MLADAGGHVALDVQFKIRSTWDTIMSELQTLEKNIERLSPDDLKNFVLGSRNSMLVSGTRRSRRIQRLGSSMHWSPKHLPSTPLERAASFEAPRVLSVLGLRLPEDLASLDGVAAVAIPIGVRGATVRDRFTQRLMAAMRSLMERHIPVFVAAGNRRPNLLAQAGIAVSTKDVSGCASTSEACVCAAVKAVYQSMCNRHFG